MNILLLVSSMHAGGAERVAATLSRGWVQHGHRVTLVPTFTGKGKLFYPLHPDVKLTWLADHLGRLAQTPLVPLVKLRALRKLVKQEKPDVIVSFLTNVNVMALMATRGLNVPIIVCERTNPAVSSSASSGLQRLRRLLYPHASMVTVQAEGSVSAMKQLVPNMKRLAVVPNPLPPDLPLPESREPAASGRQRLVAMGRFVSSKRFGPLITVFERLAARFPQWELVIWGDGPLRPELQAMVDGAGLSDRVLLPGRTQQPWKELQAADLFVLTSEVEGFPNALIEAMALGLPCVSVDCPSGPREITLDGQVARLVPLYDEAALEAALSDLMGNPEARQVLARQGARSVRERFGLEQVLVHWDRLFSEVK
ncbi:MAG TPA: glycosyltransferase family 4 protein [Burkholderiaceae bacterium]|nr:glycosyltransferase family 4 protein [Burkholderiaceae bacterium]